jgi:hypothetical protein
MAMREQIKVEWDPQVQVTEIVAQRWADAGLAVARSRGIRSLHPGHAVGNRVDVRPVTQKHFGTYTLVACLWKRHFVWGVVDCIERLTGERPNHGENGYQRPLKQFN